MHIAMHRARWPRILLAAYLVCVVLVCSFILFEVLDVDGSDFVPLPTSVDARPAESHHDDLKRIILAVALLLVTRVAAVRLLAPERAGRAESARAPRAVFPAPSSATRALLPRVALADGAASA